MRSLVLKLHLYISTLHTLCLLGVCSIIFMASYRRHRDNKGRDSIAYRVHEPLLESSWAAVVGHFKIPHSEKKV